MSACIYLKIMHLAIKKFKNILIYAKKVVPLHPKISKVALGSPINSLEINALDFFKGNV